ncbi:MAG: hypothetical protein NT126_10285 [Bacteroidetes bacterium]|nr:hypothetical protein [Bacteroidota bacterium]
MKKHSVYIGIISLATAATVIFSCNKNNENKVEPSSGQSMEKAAVRPTVITSIADMKGNSAVWFTNGKYINVTRVEVPDEEAQEERAASMPNTVITTATGCSNTFSGSARATAKKSFSTSAMVSYGSIVSLRSTLQTDVYMSALPITNSSNRVSQENRNVAVTTSYLYAIKRESDNDYHLIIGDAAPGTSANLFNCEISGLPSTSSSSYNTIKATRDFIKNRFGTDFCGQSSYTMFSPPLPVTTLHGSLFYDIDHAPGTVGPTGFRPNTSWEMHPISAIAF